METVNRYLKEYEVPLMTGAIGAGFGYLGKKLTKRDVVATHTVPHTLQAFVIISLAGVVAQEIGKRRRAP